MNQIGVDWQQRVDWDELRAARIRRLQDAMRGADIGGLLVQRFENLKYVTSLRPFTSLVYAPRYAAFLAADGDPCLLTEGGDYELFRRDMPWIRDLRVWPYDLSEAVRAIEALVGEHGLAEARMIYDDAVSPSLVDRLRALVPGVEFVDGAELIGEAKAVKHPEELKVRRAGGRQGVRGGRRGDPCDVRRGRGRAHFVSADLDGSAPADGERQAAPPRRDHPR